MLFIVQNDPDVPPGSIVSHLQTIGIAYRTVTPYSGEPFPDISGISAVIVLGGIMGANDDDRFPFLVDLKRWIRELVTADIPYLGICLGGQLLAAALGGKVHSRRWGELGFSDVELNCTAETDPLFSGMDPVFTCFQWHNDSFDPPPGSILLAGSTACPHQAFRVGKNAWGVQFHPEVTLDIVSHWCSGGNISADFLQETVAAWHSHEIPFLSSAKKLFNNFLIRCVSSRE